MSNLLSLFLINYKDPVALRVTLSSLKVENRVLVSSKGFGLILFGNKRSSQDLRTWVSQILRCW